MGGPSAGIPDDQQGQGAQWVRLGELAVDGGVVAIAGAPISENTRAAISAADVHLATDLRVSHNVPAILARSGYGDGVYPVQGLLVTAPDGTARLAQVRIVFTADELAGW
jgi:hypothetical protein